METEQLANAPVETLPQDGTEAPAAPLPAVCFENVKYSYDEEEGGEFAVNGVSLTIAEGEFVAVLGRNGSGKSTLAKLINALLRPTGGKVTVFGLDTADTKKAFDIRKSAGMVFQNPDNQTVASVVEDDVAFGPENIGLPREEIGRRIEYALDAVGMTQFRSATPSRLSGGQKQRIAIAGVLAIQPKIMILDESTAMLDPKGRREVMSVIKKLNREQGMTVILITHFMDEALQADRAIVMHRGEVVMDGAPEEIFSRSDELEMYNLTLPRAAYVCKKLQAAGMPVANAFTAEELAEAICASLQRG